MNVIREALPKVPGHWHQGSLNDGRGNFCGIGHVRQVMENNGIEIDNTSGLFFKISKIMNEVAGEQYPERAVYNLSDMYSFANFNDHPDTTEDEVVAVMEKAAVRFDEII